MIVPAFGETVDGMNEQFPVVKPTERKTMNELPESESELTVSENASGTPQLSVRKGLRKAGFTKGDKVSVHSGSGYVVLTPANVHDSETDLPTYFRNNIPDSPLESSMEARIVGNRLWEIGEQYEESGYNQVASETKHLARRFHAFCEKDD